MINLKYDDWVNACEIIEKYSKDFGKYYLQLYPFYKWNDLSIIKEENYFNSYIKNGFFLNNYSNFDLIDNYSKKGDGGFRRRYLITPIFYIYYIAIGLHIEKNYKQTRNEKIFVKYGGDFENDILHYDTSYQSFINHVDHSSKKYKYYCKLDISDYFNKLDINKLISLLSNKMGLSAMDQLFLKEFLLSIGKGNFPQTECGTTSVFLATIVYFELIDNKLYNFLTKDEDITAFEICRYVDDLYIFMDFDGRKNKRKIENRIVTTYESIIFEYNLSINKNKIAFKPTSCIYEDLKSFSLIPDLLNTNVFIPLEFQVKLYQFLNELSKFSEKQSFNYEDYRELINKYFENPDSKFHANQILYVLIYRNIDWLHAPKIISKITDIISNDIDVISVDPRKLVSLITNTKDENLIKKFLYRLFQKSENHLWNVNHNFMALQYLLNRNFKSSKLINSIKINSPEITSFIEKYYINDWRGSVITNEQLLLSSKIDISMNKLILFKFLEITSVKQKNYLEAQSYNKNYFDCVTNCIEYKYIGKKSQKINYTTTQLKNIYVSGLSFSTQDFDNIQNLCNKRNENPLCHANGKLLTSHNMVKDISDTITKTNDLIIDIMYKLQ